MILLPYFLIALAWACHALGRVRWTALAIGLVAGLMAIGTGVQEQTAQKKAWRETAVAWPQTAAPAFYVVLPEHHEQVIAHHLGGRVRHTPRALLERLSPLPEGAYIWVMRWPDPLPAEAAEYQDWLKGVGDARSLVLPSHYTITQVEPRGRQIEPASKRGRFRRHHGPYDIWRQLSGFSDATRFGPIRFTAMGDPYRDSAETAWLRLDNVAELETIVIRARVPARSSAANRDRALSIHLMRGERPDGLFTAAQRVLDLQPSPDPGEFRIAAPAGEHPLWLGWKRGAADREDSIGEGLQVHWLGIEASSESNGHLAQALGTEAVLSGGAE